MPQQPPEEHRIHPDTANVRRRTIDTLGYRQVKHFRRKEIDAPLEEFAVVGREWELYRDQTARGPCYSGRAGEFATKLRRL